MWIICEAFKCYAQPVPIWGKLHLCDLSLECPFYFTHVPRVTPDYLRVLRLCTWQVTEWILGWIPMPNGPRV